ncbi:ABC-type cobalamin/Fe3+-siderophores transport system [Commensalibacter communis]|uniref:ATPase component (FepC) n=1 Tax=Commensalibacter communis TaxID=2972786 RepID=A0A9W4X7G0_9PROT|nr:ABC transporter ATP-binding protein [Commensalibacter communis]CAI3955627.1 ABC-type cobalamin/Fe3+-siderophores transport system [Commensalibacter communis]CAI3957803.1 ABC-type cobalamin/Fe3+-siderophores transport system [Commensalibacter communis]CAI3958051.1 ABC-type cobalamin/Fe3+-siderophores transport system [Commensalibacter communis]CAI3959252.1 ABC-type cobalamin/Fe3+-siderophores transport system [Commensalibacter communis]
MKSNSSSLSVRGLNVHYGHEKIINGIDLLDIQSGKLTVLAGSNGAGKSTILRAIAGLIRARGSIEWEGKDLMTMSTNERAKIVGFMPQSISATYGLTVLESVIIASQTLTPVIGTTKHEDQALSTLERVGIIDLAMKHLGGLSGGQRQLASLAQSLVRNPKILLLDEPTSALDLRHQIEVMALLKSVASSGCIVIVVLHDLMLASNWADHLIFLHEGHIVGAGEPKAVLTSNLLEKIYGVKASIARTKQGTEHLVIHKLSTNMMLKEGEYYNG